MGYVGVLRKAGKNSPVEWRWESLCLEWEISGFEKREALSGMCVSAERLEPGGVIF